MMYFLDWTSPQIELPGILNECSYMYDQKEVASNPGEPFVIQSSRRVTPRHLTERHNETNRQRQHI